MSESWFDTAVRDLVEGRPVDWTALADRTPAADRARLEALRLVAEAVAARHGGADARERWGPFELIEPIGHGGYGEVWRARDPELDRIVALKIVPAEDDREVEQVLSEGRLLARVRHPNVAAVYAAIRLEGEVGVAMEFVEGDDLERSVRTAGPLDADAIVAVGVQLARALGAVHGAGVLHRDIKASNVKRAGNGRVVLLDFGSSREQQAHAADARLEPGTPLYVAPELFHGQPATPRSDLYSLGVLLYFLASGDYPVRAATLEDLRATHASLAAGSTAPVRAPLTLPYRLRRLIEALLAADPTRRPSSATEVAAELSGRPRLRAFGAAALTLAAVGAATVFVVRAPHSASDSGGPGPETARKLPWSVAPMEIGRPSADGRILPFADRRSGALAVMTIATGAIRDLTADGGTADGYAGYSVASPDGTRIAYEWAILQDEKRELRIIDVASGRVTTLWRGNHARIQPTSWSADGSRIAGLLGHEEDDSSDLFIADIIPGTGPTRVLTNAFVDSPAFSDEGTLLAFEKRDSPRGPTSLWLTNVQTRETKPLVLPQPDPHTPLWHGHTIAFGSATGLWDVPVNPMTGDIDGVPRQLSDERSDLLGIASDGSIICERRTGTIEIAIAGIDGTGARQVSTGPGAHYSPDWSPDGATVAWIDEAPPPAATKHVVRLHPMNGAAERTLDLAPPGDLIGANPRFSPDGTRILLRTGNNGFFAFNLQTGQSSAPLFAHRNFGDIEWDDDTHVWVLEFDKGVARVDLTDGHEEWLYRLPPRLWMGRGIAVTRDRARVAFVLMSGANAEVATIMVMSRDGSAPKPLLTRTRATTTFRLQQFAASPLLLGEWTPAGELLFAATDIRANGFVNWDTDLWAIPADGGAPRKTGLSARGLRDIRPDPGGSHVLYTMFDLQFDIWVLKGLWDPQVSAR